MAGQYIQKYECVGCHGFHSDSDAARDCCEPEKVFVCVKCLSEQGAMANRFSRKSDIEKHLAECDTVDEFPVLERELIQQGVNRVDIERYRLYRDGVDSETREFRRLMGVSPFADIEAVHYAR